MSIEIDSTGAVGTQSVADEGRREVTNPLVLVGLGYWGPNLLRNMMNLTDPSEITVVDASLDRLAAGLATYPNLRCALSLDQVLDEQPPGAVIIATPITTHASLARRALERGWSVMVEKPLATSYREGLELVELAETRGLTLMVGHTFLFSPKVQRVAEYLESGRIGNIQYATSSRLNLGLHQADTSVIWDLGPHDFSILFHLLGEFPDRVQTVGRAVVGSHLPATAFVSLSFPSGIVASVMLSWLAPKKIRNTTIVGDEQMVTYDDLDADEPIRIYDKGIVLPDGGLGEHPASYRFGDVHSPYVSPGEPLSLELAHFLGSVAGVEKCRSNGRFGLGVVAALAAADRSWQEGGLPVSIDDEYSCFPV